MFNSTQDLKLLLDPSKVFSNSDEIYCPITSFLLKSSDYLIDYQGSVLSLDQNNNILAKMNSPTKIEENFCIEVANKDQVIFFDNIMYA